MRDDHDAVAWSDDRRVLHELHRGHRVRRAAGVLQHGRARGTPRAGWCRCPRPRCDAPDAAPRRRRGPAPWRCRRSACARARRAATDLRGELRSMLPAPSGLLGVVCLGSLAQLRACGAPRRPCRRCVRRSSRTARARGSPGSASRAAPSWPRRLTVASSSAGPGITAATMSPSVAVSCERITTMIAVEDAGADHRVAGDAQGEMLAGASEVGRHRDVVLDLLGRHEGRAGRDPTERGGPPCRRPCASSVDEASSPGAWSGPCGATPSSRGWPAGRARRRTT